MFCNNCGAEINDQAVICPKCGVPTVKNSNLGVKETAPNSVGALICGILGWVFCLIPIVGLVLSIIGLCLSISGRNKAAKDPARYGSTAMLIVAMVFSIIGLVAALASIVYLLIGGYAMFEYFDFIEDLLY